AAVGPGARIAAGNVVPAFVGRCFTVFHVGAVGAVGIVRAVCNLGNLVAAVVQAIVAQMHVVRSTGNGNAAIVNHGVTRGHGAVSAEIDLLGQLERQRVSTIGFYADVVVNQRAGGVTLDIERIAQLAVNVRTTVARKSDWFSHSRLQRADITAVGVDHLVGGVQLATVDGVGAAG